MTANIAAKISSAYIHRQFKRIPNRMSFESNKLLWWRWKGCAAIPSAPGRNNKTIIVNAQRQSGSPCSFDGIPINRVTCIYDSYNVFFRYSLTWHAMYAPANGGKKITYRINKTLLESRNNRIDIGGECSREVCARWVALMENLYFQILRWPGRKYWIENVVMQRIPEMPMWFMDYICYITATPDS